LVHVPHGTILNEYMFGGMPVIMREHYLLVAFNLELLENVRKSKCKLGLASVNGSPVCILYRKLP
jgi:hypothetical protein